MTAMLASDLPLPRIGRGKVRDIYAVGDDHLLLLTTDRISAFDVVMAETIPMKGAVLTQISAFWFRKLAGSVPHHMVTVDTDAIISEAPVLKDHRADILGRAMLCRRTNVFPIECVIRGYISGSAWKEYAAHGTLAGEELPTGLSESARLEPAIFSPATKVEIGHDENIAVSRMREILGGEVTETLERMTRAIYAVGETQSRERGIIIADTKCEFGRDREGCIILIDEVMTPIAPASGLSRLTGPAIRSRVSISSHCATISTANAKPDAGTATPRRRYCQQASCKQRAIVTSKRIAG